MKGVPNVLLYSNLFGYFSDNIPEAKILAGELKILKDHIDHYLTCEHPKL